MIDENLVKLSFEQLEAIQSRVSKAILDKRAARLSEAIKDILDLLDTRYPDINLWDVLSELVDTQQLTESPESTLGTHLKMEPDPSPQLVVNAEPTIIALELPGQATVEPNTNDSPVLEARPPAPPLESPRAVVAPTSQPVVNSQPKEAPPAPLAPRLNAPPPPPKRPSPKPQPPEAQSPEPEYDKLSLPDPVVFSERLRAIRGEVLQYEDARLLWLTNDGSQKTSKLSGKDLADLLQETIKKLERLYDTDSETEAPMSLGTLNREVLRISEWSEFYLGVSLLRGTLTVISPFAARDLPVKGYAPMPISSTLTIADMRQQTASKGEVNVPFAQYLHTSSSH